MSKGILGPALSALRTYWMAVLLFQGMAAATAGIYHFFPTTHGLFQSLQAFRETGGVWFVVGANILSGGVLPELLKAKMRPAGRPGPSPGDLVHLFVLMGLLGIMVMVFYAAQGAWFGQGTDPGTIARKILCDQFGYSLFIVTPFVLIWFAWKENGYSIKKTLRALNVRFFLDRVPPMFVPSAIFWMPALVALYALPADLQLLLFLLLNAAWCTLMVFIARDLPKTSPDSGNLPT